MSKAPVIPTYILRGHNAPVHSLLFLRNNAVLASGDSDGWLIIWSLASKRATGVWKAHQGGITGIKPWPPDRLITHGRDHKLRVWKLDLGEDVNLSTALPVDGAADEQQIPWLYHAMDMSALNFCTFAICKGNGLSESDQLLLGSPNGIDSGGVDVFRLPSQTRILQLHSQKQNTTGMVMALAMFKTSKGELCLVSGYEDGRVMIHLHADSVAADAASWQQIMEHKPHTQPILSLTLSPQYDYCISSSADAVLAKMEIPDFAASRSVAAGSIKITNTKHAGQQGLAIRSDGKILATAGWDARTRVYSTKTMSELAVLKWHKDGCSSTAFAEILTANMVKDDDILSPVSSHATSLDRIRNDRNSKAQQTHWLASGGKDGKIALWDIY